MALPMIMAGMKMVGWVVSAFGAGKAAREAKDKAAAAERRIAELEASRQDVIDPYEEAMQMITNPFANLGVASQAAGFQAEQADISLARTLDTLRATGAGTGGATALAQAALQSKRGISATLEQQEARNQQLRAQGQSAMEKQLAAMSGAGSQFEWQAQETREMQQLDRQSSLMSSYSQQAAAYQKEASQAWGQALGGAGSAGIGGILGPLMGNQ